ncbi:MBL fold metallo-hydrolase [Brevibacillus sp. SAFN-007a]|uniref:MBL fold metallo-hydrolase n=1 Tax=Brevibacillus sp. SAFN-007a TaxID=3436862 RepID=UPI003F7D4805
MIEVHQHEDVLCLEGVVKRAGREWGIHVYVTDGMMVDTGPQSLAADLIARFSAVSFDAVVLTHSHEDHSGNAAWLVRSQNVPVYIHEKGVELCSRPADYPLYRQLVWGMREPFAARPLAEAFHSRTVDWEVIHTPGHAHDHVALFDKQTGRLFAGDLFLGTKTKVILRDESIPLLIESIRRVLTRDFQAMYCAHAGYMAKGKDLLMRKLDDLLQLQGEILRLHGQGLTVAEINGLLFAKPSPIIAASEGEFDSVHIVTSVLAGLPQTESKSIV